MLYNYVCLQKARPFKMVTVDCILLHTDLTIHTVLIEYYCTRNNQTTLCVNIHSGPSQRGVYTAGESDCIKPNVNFTTNGNCKQLSIHKRETRAVHIYCTQLLLSAARAL